MSLTLVRADTISEAYRVGNGPPHCASMSVRPDARGPAAHRLSFSALNHALRVFDKDTIGFALATLLRGRSAALAGDRRVRVDRAIG